MGQIVPHREHHQRTIATSRCQEASTSHPIDSESDTLTSMLQSGNAGSSHGTWPCKFVRARPHLASPALASFGSPSELLRRKCLMRALSTDWGGY